MNAGTVFSGGARDCLTVTAVGCQCEAFNAEAVARRR